MSIQITTEGVLADKALSLVVFIKIDPTNFTPIQKERTKKPKTNK